MDTDDKRMASTGWRGGLGRRGLDRRPDDMHHPSTHRIQASCIMQGQCITQTLRQRFKFMHKTNSSPANEGQGASSSSTGVGHMEGFQGHNEG